MAAWALSEYKFKGNTLLGLFMAIGIMIPIRIGTVAILEMMVATGLVNTLWALILVYTAQGLPLAVFILSFSTVIGAASALPGGLGAAEASITAMLSLLVGLNREAASTATLLIRFATLWFGVLLGLAAWLTSRKFLGLTAPPDKKNEADESLAAS